MKPSVLATFVVIDTLISILINVLINSPGTIVFASFVIRFLSVSLIAVVCYLLGNMILELSHRSCWVYVVSFVIGYLLIAFCIWIIRDVQVGLVRTFVELHRGHIFIVVYLPYLLSSLVLIVVGRWFWPAP